MTELNELMKHALAKKTMVALMAILDSEKMTLADGNEPVLDLLNATVDMMGMSFQYHAGKLTMIGACPVCGQDCHSVPVRSFADVADLMLNFRPSRHPCVVT